MVTKINVDKEPTVIKGPLPGEAVERHYRKYGHLPKKGCCNNDQVDPDLDLRDEYKMYKAVGEATITVGDYTYTTGGSHTPTPTGGGEYDSEVVFDTTMKPLPKEQMLPAKQKTKRKKRIKPASYRKKK